MSSLPTHGRCPCLAVQSCITSCAVAMPSVVWHPFLHPNWPASKAGKQLSSLLSNMRENSLQRQGVRAMGLKSWGPRGCGTLGNRHMSPTFQVGGSFSSPMSQPVKRGA